MTAASRRTRVLIVQEKVPAYRVPLFEALSRADGLEVAVLHSDPAFCGRSPGFRETCVASRRLPGGLRWQAGVRRHAAASDVAVAMFDVHWLSTVLLLLRPGPRPPVVLWGHGYGRNRLGRPLRARLARRADALLLYAEEDRQAFVEAGVDPGRVLVAPNTVFVDGPRRNRESRRTDFLYVGRLQPRKRVEDLLSAFARCQAALRPEVRVRIVGDGEESGRLRGLARSLGIADRVLFTGSVTDEQALRPWFDAAIAYVCPGAVGLGVLHSFAFGVPVVTAARAGHGPEARAVVPGETGILYDGSVASLAAVLPRLAAAEAEARTLGENALAHYTSRRLPQQMVAGFLDAIAVAAGRGGRAR
jgi:glycosyltransferase involved in cell wall biosynthesis